MRVLVADGQPKVRFALRTLLERSLGLEVAGEATDIQALRQQLEKGRPDMLMLDWNLPGPKPRNWIAALRRQCPRLRIIALSGHLEDQQAAVAAGANAFVCKCDPPDRLLQAIEALSLCPASSDAAKQAAPGNKPAGA